MDMPSVGGNIQGSGAHYNGAGGIHDTLITKSADNTILDYDTRTEI